MRETCNQCARSFNSQYPLTNASFERAFRAGDTCHWREVARKFGKEPIEIAVVGGSMTMCHFCGKCSWASRLQAKFDPKLVTVVNHAKAGHSYRHWIEVGELLEIKSDIILSDLVVNSGQYLWMGEDKAVKAIQSDLDEYLHIMRYVGPNRAVMMVQTFTAGSGNHLHYCQRDCPTRPKQAFNYEMLYNHTHPYCACDIYWKMADVERPILDHYHLPVSSYRDAVWPELNSPPPNLNCFWNGALHPDSNAHQLIADVVYDSILRMIEAARQDIASPSEDVNCPQVAPFHPDMHFEHCIELDFKSHMKFSHPESFQPISRPPLLWRWREDRAMKPGWIVEFENATDFTSNEISFAVEVGSHRQVDITFLRSYAQVGKVEVLFTPKGAETPLFRLEIQAQTSNTWASTPYTTKVLFSDHGHKDAPLGEYILTFSLLDDPNLYHKFKLMGLTSC